MRTAISIIAASILLAIILYLSCSENFVLPDYWTGVALLLTGTAITVLAWGFKPKIEKVLSKKNSIEQINVLPSKIELKNEVAKQNDLIHTGITITNDFIDKCYNEALRNAIQTYDDAALSGFTFQYFLFKTDGSEQNIYFEFYSKFAGRIYKTSFHSHYRYKFTHSTPDEHVRSESDRKILDVLPWKRSPHWKEFIEKYYAKVGPITANEKSSIHLWYNCHPVKDEFYWKINVFDGYTGREYFREWDGRDLLN